MYNDQILKTRRQELRRAKTKAEDVLWNHLRDRQIDSLKFYRQYSVGPYVLDFYCPKTRLAIELDGEQHKGSLEYDKEREYFLTAKNIKIIRFWNRELLNNIDQVLDVIKSTSPLS